MRVVGGDEDLERGRIPEFLEELAAVAARGCGDGESNEARAAMDGEVVAEELLCVDGLIQRETRELEIDAYKNAAVGAEADGPDGEVGDGRASKGLGWLNQGGEEVEDGGETQ